MSNGNSQPQLPPVIIRNQTGITTNGRQPEQFGLRVEQGGPGNQLYANGKPVNYDPETRTATLPPEVLQGPDVTLMVTDRSSGRQSMQQTFPINHVRPPNRWWTIIQVILLIGSLSGLGYMLWYYHIIFP